MLAFLKRRWILLSVVGALMIAAFLNVLLFWETGDTWQEGSEHSVQVTDGGITYTYYHQHFLNAENRANFFDYENKYELKHFSLGRMHPSYQRLTAPSFGNETEYFMFYIPFWMFLAGVVGWIVIRELRWREKRAEAAAEQAK